MVENPNVPHAHVFDDNFLELAERRSRRKIFASDESVGERFWERSKLRGNVLRIEFSIKRDLAIQGRIWTFEVDESS